MPRPPIPVPRGERYGRLTVVADRDGKAPRVWVHCDCGSPEKLVPVGELRRRTNPLQSCGCATREAVPGNLPRTSLPAEPTRSEAHAPEDCAGSVGGLRLASDSARSRSGFGISRRQVQRVWYRESWTQLG